MTFNSQFPKPAGLNPTHINAARLAAREKILRGDHGRFVFSNCIHDVAAMRVLPPGHLFDHRFRGALPVEFLKLRGKVVTSANQKRLLSAVTDILGRMLDVSDQPGARDLLSSALQLDPNKEASAIAQLAVTHRPLVRLLLRGCLGTAARYIRANMTGGAQDDAFRLVEKMLLYFSCLSIQIVGARAWHIENPPFRPAGSKGPYRIKGFLIDLRNLAAMINRIGAYTRGKVARPPNQKMVAELKPLAQDWRAFLGLNEEELQTQLPALFKRLADPVRWTRKWASRRLERVQGNITLHSELFGLTSAEALAFASARLVQLRDKAGDLVSEASRGVEIDFPAVPGCLPLLDDTDVATILFVYRVTLLDDLSSVFGSPARQANRNPNDIGYLYAQHFVKSEIMLGKDIIDHSRGSFFKEHLTRAPLRMRAARQRSCVLTRAQSLDVLPEFWLESDAKVVASPPTSGQLLSDKQIGQAREIQNRPSSQWFANPKRNRRSRL